MSEEVSCLSHIRHSRGFLVAIVALAILLDNMLLTTVVPIIPTYLYQLKHEQQIIVTQDVQENVDNIMDPMSSTVENEEKPFFLNRKPSHKQTKSNWNIPGFTVVPDDLFWPFTNAESTMNTTQGSNEVQMTQNENWNKELRHQELVSESFEVGILFAAKPIFQALTNPFVGPLCNRIGYSVPMFSGFIIMFGATLIFAVGREYVMLLIARSLQGMGSACTSVAGMGMLAVAYPNDEERGNAMALALGGLALGVLIGPVFGGTLYEFVGKAAPFLILSVLALVDGFLQWIVLQPKIVKQTKEGTPLLTLMKDPYILVAAGAICFSNLGIAVLEPSLPLWMMDTMDATKWQQGIAFLPASISYLIGTNVFGPLGHKMGRWLASLTGLLVIGVCLLCVPVARNVQQLIPANAGIGFAIGMVDSSMMPMLGYLVDSRHTSVYGSVYAIADISFCMGFIIGPIFSASIVKRLGFEGLVYIVAFINFLYAPLMVILRNPPKKEIEVVETKKVHYASYQDEIGNQGNLLKRLMDEENEMYN